MPKWTQGCGIRYWKVVKNYGIIKQSLSFLNSFEFWKIFSNFEGIEIKYNFFRNCPHSTVLEHIPKLGILNPLLRGDYFLFKA